LFFAPWWGYSPWHRWCPGTIKKPGSPYYLFPSLVSVIWLFEPNATLAYRILEIANVFDFAFAFVYVFGTQIFLILPLILNKEIQHFCSDLVEEFSEVFVGDYIQSF